MTTVPNVDMVMIGDMMDNFEKWKIIEESLNKALEEVYTARVLIHTIENDYNTIYPRGLDKFISQLENYVSWYERKMNHAIREKYESEVVKKGGTENQ